MAKKTTKPKQPEVKLIEGKYSHKFLVRLTPHEGEYLQSAMVKHGHKTYTGMIIKMIFEYEKQRAKIQSLEKELSELRFELRDTKADLSEISWAIKKAVNYVDAPDTNDENEDMDDY